MAELVAFEVAASISGTESLILGSGLPLPVDRELPFGAGDAILLRFVYDAAAEDENPAIGAGTYTDEVVEASVELPDSGLSFAFDGGRSGVETMDDQFLGDFFGFGTQSPILGDAIDGEVVEGFGFAFRRGGSAPLLVVDDRPNPPFAFDAGSSINFTGLLGGSGEQFLDQSFLAAGEAVIVPVPESDATAAAIASALALWLRRPRRTIVRERTQSVSPSPRARADSYPLWQDPPGSGVRPRRVRPILESSASCWPRR